MKRGLVLTILLLLASGQRIFAQALIDGIQPTAVNGVTASGGAFNGISLAAPVVTVVQSQNSNNSATLTLGTAVTSGNILVAAFYSGTNTDTLTATDTLGNTFVTLSPTGGLATDADGLAIVCAPITTGGTDTIQFKVNGGGTAAWSIAYEVHSTHGTCTQDVTAVHSNTTAATSCTSGAMTTTTANDFLVAVCGLDGTNTATITAGSGWLGGLNAIFTGPTRPIVMSEYQVAVTPGSFTATSGTFASEEQGTVMVAIKP